MKCEADKVKKTSETESTLPLVVSAWHLVKILDLSDRSKRYFDDFAARTFHLYTRSSQSLGGFHALNDAANAPAINGDDLNVVFSV